MLLYVSFFLRVISDTLRVMLKCHIMNQWPKETVQVGTLLRSQNGSEERGFVVGYSLSKVLTFSPFTAYLWMFSFLLSNKEYKLYTKSTTNFISEIEYDFCI